MKISRTDAHDRFSFYQKQDFDIAACCQNLIDKRPFGDHPFYIFAHARTLGLDEKLKLFSSGRYANFMDIPEKTIIWQPRLTKPKAQTNSMLFKGYPGTDHVKVIWIIPPRELWSQFKKGLMTENESITISIHDFEHNREQLEAKEEDDLPDEVIDRIYREISSSIKKDENGRFKTL
jgi:hypothetical protein